MTGSDERGFALAELLVAVMVMTVGVMALMSTFDSSRQVASSAEMRNVAATIGQREVERVKALTYPDVALLTAPGQDASNPNDPLHYVEPGGCGTSPGPCYQWDQSGPPTASNSEPLVIGSTQDTTSNPWTTSVPAPSGGTRLQLTVYRFITQVNDPSCTGSCQPGYKRVTVAVTVNGLRKPVLLSSFVADTQGSALNPLTNGATTCLDNGQYGACPH
jgi:type II secretory pathway pseudopilin PulG